MCVSFTLPWFPGLIESWLHTGTQWQRMSVGCQAFGRLQLNQQSLHRRGLPQTHICAASRPLSYAYTKVKERKWKNIAAKIHREIFTASYRHHGITSWGKLYVGNDIKSCLRIPFFLDAFIFSRWAHISQWCIAGVKNISSISRSFFLSPSSFHSLPLHSLQFMTLEARQAKCWRQFPGVTHRAGSAGCTPRPRTALSYDRPSRANR